MSIQNTVTYIFMNKVPRNDPSDLCHNYNHCVHSSLGYGRRLGFHCIFLWRNRKVTFIACYEFVNTFILKPDMDMNKHCAFMGFPIQKERGRQTKQDGSNSKSSTVPLAVLFWHLNLKQLLKDLESWFVLINKEFALQLQNV